ncbi:hypothetical protein [Paenibacillus sp.]|jgi:hypothetical protein|uniref:hypothetical protein n=1 Tax=Paenibacillus sp. TaxID=58172 RepID=UPI00281FBE94|nr:hypothetical protein [Paenibacillus sp.]MDR0271159.1 hypothetical protein [Paenibacillus sp.]
MIFKRYFKIVALSICFALLFGVVFENRTFAQDVSNEIEQDFHNQDIKILENSEKYIKLFKEVDGVTGTMVLDKETTNITLTTNERNDITNEDQTVYNVVIDDVRSNELSTFNESSFISPLSSSLLEPPEDIIKATFTAPGKEYIIDPDRIAPRNLIGIGVIIGEELLSQLLKLALAVTVGGVAFAVVTEVRDKLRNEGYDYYEAKLMSGDLWIGRTIDSFQAVSRILGSDFYNNNVWSKSSKLAKELCFVALPVEPEGPEVTCNQLKGYKYYSHYHLGNRKGGHSFF